MTFSEFEYWLDGLKEGMHGKPPTVKQWEKIQKKLKEVAPPSYPYSWPWYATTTIPYTTTTIPYITTIPAAATTTWKDNIGTWSATNNTGKIPYTLTN